MGSETKIEWCDRTFNPWIGCTKISPACDHCYAESWAKRSGLVKWGGERRRTSVQNWNLPLKWNREAAKAGTRPRVFCASLADVFDNEVPPAWRSDLFALIAATPHLDWLLLTKRIGNARLMLPWGILQPGQVLTHEPPNVWIGATICNQEEADRDIPKLLDTPAAIRFLSIEPMLSQINVGPYLSRANMPGFKLLPGFRDSLTGIDWVISGGESGPHARPSHPDWFRSLRDQCAAAGVPYLHKQNGEWVSVSEVEGPGRNYAFPDGTTVRRTGKALAGRTIDGKVHNGFPA